MCEHGEIEWMEELGPYGRYIDKCMVIKIKEVLAMGAETVACCCGHGKYSETIVIRYEDGYVMELNSQKHIPRIRNFYRMDEDGLYFIPEVVEYNKVHQ